MATSTPSPKPSFGAYSNPDIPASASKNLVDGIEADLSQQVEDTKGDVEVSRSYEDILKDAGISLTEAQAIADDILMRGFYEETIKLTKKISVVFRTRTHADFIRFNLAVEAHNPRFNTELNEIQLRYFLAASISRFGETKFAHPSLDKASDEEVNKAFDDRLEWVQRQPERVVALLADKLNRFDRKVATVLAEGVVENF